MKCPVCHGPVDGALNVDGRPDPRDWTPTVCPNCRSILTFDSAEPDGVRLTVSADWTAWGADPPLLRRLSQVMQALERTET